MLELRPSCEHCDHDLPAKSTEAMICTYECTFCRDCALNVFENICPNCGGNFVPRPLRPYTQLTKHPPSTTRIHNPKDMNVFKTVWDKYVNQKPEDR